MNFRNHAVTPEEQLMLALRYYATGSFLITIGDFVGVHNSTASRIIVKVSEAIASLSRQFINMPKNDTESDNMNREFYNIARFPGVIGTIDCTHVRILSPGKQIVLEIQHMNK